MSRICASHTAAMSLLRGVGRTCLAVASRTEAIKSTRDGKRADARSWTSEALTKSGKRSAIDCPPPTPHGRSEPSPSYPVGSGGGQCDVDQQIEPEREAAMGFSDLVQVLRENRDWIGQLTTAMVTILVSAWVADQRACDEGLTQDAIGQPQRSNSAEVAKHLRAILKEAKRV